MDEQLSRKLVPLESFDRSHEGSLLVGFVLRQLNKIHFLIC